MLNFAYVCKYEKKKLAYQEYQWTNYRSELNSKLPVEIKEGAQMKFSYSVTWKDTAKNETRFNRYLDNSFFEHQIY